MDQVSESILRDVITELDKIANDVTGGGVTDEDIADRLTEQTDRMKTVLWNRSSQPNSVAEAGVPEGISIPSDAAPLGGRSSDDGNGEEDKEPVHSNDDLSVG